MTIHYHGTPITPRNVLHTLAGRHFCVSFAAQQDIAACHDLGQGVMLDNGAFSAWRAKRKTDWPGYYIWCEKWLKYQTTWAVIPDIIDGSEDENDALILQWPHGDRGAPVWHLHENISRLVKLSERYSRICIGSSGEYSSVGSKSWHTRMTETMNVFCQEGVVPCWIHMLRGMSMSGMQYPFASVDSTDIARNHHLSNKHAVLMADRWDKLQCPGLWEKT